MWVHTVRSHGIAGSEGRLWCGFSTSTFYIVFEDGTRVSRLPGKLLCLGCFTGKSLHLFKERFACVLLPSNILLVYLSSELWAAERTVVCLMPWPATCRGGGRCKAAGHKREGNLKVSSVTQLWKEWRGWSIPPSRAHRHHRWEALADRFPSICPSPDLWQQAVRITKNLGFLFSSLNVFQKNNYVVGADKFIATRIPKPLVVSVRRRGMLSSKHLTSHLSWPCGKCLLEFCGLMGTS